LGNSHPTHSRLLLPQSALITCMKKLSPTVLLLGLSLCLSACTPTPPALQIDPGQVYLGYPCGDNCGDFKAGYEAARDQNLHDADACGTDVSPRTTGCKAFVLDLKILEDPTGGFIFAN
jgi:hypothetical protein